MDSGEAAVGAEGVDAEASMEGFLYKRGALNKAFKKRFFRQQGTRLVYFMSPVCALLPSFLLSLSTSLLTLLLSLTNIYATVTIGLKEGARGD